VQAIPTHTSGGNRPEFHGSQQHHEIYSFLFLKIGRIRGRHPHAAQIEAAKAAADQAVAAE
jgi:hypothetical protein